MAKKGPTGPGGLILLDKPAGMTSHDVVSKVRRIAGTRRVGHAGTLDPMATGVLVLGVERSTKLMNHLILTDKTYLATIRLGEATSTDDAEGTVLSTASAAELDPGALEAAIATLTGEILQRPSSVSAIKVAGERAYALVRAGETVDLAPRPVTVERFEVVGEPRRVGDYLDLDVVVDCTSGTYVRALARDLGGQLGVGGHLTALRRTRVGVFTLDQALTLEQLAELPDPLMLPLPQAIAATMPVRRLTADEASELTFGRSIALAGIEGVYGGIAETGEAVALLREFDGRARPVLGFTPAS
jgi:tRNA pseudouridine55 synthase